LQGSRSKKLYNAATWILINSNVINENYEVFLSLKVLQRCRR
jgi:hypothetical protein